MTTHTAPTVPDFATGIPAATVAFRATLTATSNPYLSDRLPLGGLVRIGERDVRGNCTRVEFLPDPEQGRSTSFVAVPDARFEFSSRI